MISSFGEQRRLPCPGATTSTKSSSSVPGPIQIGQAAEFDYSGTQACKALRGAGFTVVLVNSNPATIMTDPEVADKTYIEPLTPEFVEKVIRKEKPDALLADPRRANRRSTSPKRCTKRACWKSTASSSSAQTTTRFKREKTGNFFRQAMAKIGVATSAGKMVGSVAEGLEFAHSIGYPAIIRPSFTLGGTGGGIAYDESEFRDIVTQGLHDSPVHTVLVEQSVLGWKEYELEVMRDTNDTVVIICSIENLDPIGRSYRRLDYRGPRRKPSPTRNISGSATIRLRLSAKSAWTRAGSNIQFAVNPKKRRRDCD